MDTEAQILIDKKDKTAKVYINGAFYRKLPRGVFRKAAKIRKINEEKIRDYLEGLEKKAAERYIVWLLGKKNYLAEQILKKLKLKGFSKNLADSLIAKYKNLGFLNDKAFLKGAVLKEKRKGNSRKMTAYKLQMLGIKQTEIQDSLEKFYPPEEEQEVFKKMRQKKPGKPAAFWLRKGFEASWVFSS